MNTSTTNRVVGDSADGVRHGSKTAKQRAAGTADGLARLFVEAAGPRFTESSTAPETQATFQEALDRTLSTLTAESPRSKTQTKARAHQQAGAWAGSGTDLESGLTRPCVVGSTIRRSSGDTRASVPGQDQEMTDAVSQTRADKKTGAGGSIAAAEVSDHTAASPHSSKGARKSRSSAEASGREPPQAERQVLTAEAAGQGARPEETPTAVLCAAAGPVETPTRASAPVASQTDEKESRTLTVDLERGSHKVVQAGPDLRASSTPANRPASSQPKALARREPGAGVVTSQTSEAGSGAKEGTATASRIEAEGQVDLDAAALAQQDVPVAKSLQKDSTPSGTAPREAGLVLKTASTPQDGRSEGIPDKDIPRLHAADRKDLHSEAGQANEGPESGSVRGQQAGHSTPDAETLGVSAASSSTGLSAGPKTAQTGGAVSGEAAGNAPHLTEARPARTQQGLHLSIADSSVAVRDVSAAGKAEVQVQAGQETASPEQLAGQSPGPGNSRIGPPNRPVQAVDQIAASRDRISAGSHDRPVFWQMEQSLASGQPADIAAPVEATSERSGPQAPRQGQGVDPRSMPEQVLSSIRGAIESGSHRLTVELDPPELGKVTIRFEQHGGSLVGVLEVDRRSTAGDLEKALPQIVHNLSDSGVQVRRLEVAVNDRHPQQTGDGATYGMYQGRSGQQDQGQHTPHADPLAYSSSSPATTGDSAGHDRPQASLGSGGSIDLLM
jgi:hypothetical protein